MTDAKITEPRRDSDTVHGLVLRWHIRNQMLHPRGICGAVCVGCAGARQTVLTTIGH